MLSALPADEYPLIVAVAAEMGAYGSDDHYEFVLDQLVAGLRTAAGPGSAAKSSGRATDFQVGRALIQSRLCPSESSQSLPSS